MNIFKIQPVSFPCTFVQYSLTSAMHFRSDSSRAVLSHNHHIRPLFPPYLCLLIYVRGVEESLAGGRSRWHQSAAPGGCGNPANQRHLDRPLMMEYLLSVGNNRARVANYTRHVTHPKTMGSAWPPSLRVKGVEEFFFKNNFVLKIDLRCRA